MAGDERQDREGDDRAAARTRLRGRNLLLGGVLLLLVLLLYAISFVKTPGAPDAPSADAPPAATGADRMQPAPAAQPLSGLRGN